MRPIFAIPGVLLMSLQGVAAAAASAPIDPTMTGLWVPVYGKTAQTATGEFDMFPDGTLIERVYAVQGTPSTTTYLPITNDGPKPYLQWTINDTTLKPTNVESATATFSNGNFTITYADGTVNTGTYQLSANHRVMTLTMGNVQLAFRMVADSNGNLLPPSQPKAAATSSPVDPNLAGLWLESIPMPDQGYTQDTIFEIHPSGQFVAHIQHVTPQQNIEVGNSNSDFSTGNYTLRGANGRYTVINNDGSTVMASYVFSPGRKKMIVVYDQDTYGFLFVHLGDVGADDSLSLISGSKDLTDNHVVDPRLIGVWVGEIQNTNSITYKLIEWHPNGDFVMHVRNVTGSQSVMDVKDTNTYPGEFDAFSGRFLLNEPKGLRETGVYSFKPNASYGTELDLSWDTAKTQTDSYRVFGDFDANGAIRPLPTAK
jgi:hypothetical protein